jgi:hypothetical protein
VLHGLGEAGQKGGFAPVSGLIDSVVPGPTLQRLIAERLARVHNDEVVLIGQLIHMCHSRKVSGPFVAAVEHDEERNR